MVDWTGTRADRRRVVSVAMTMVVLGVSFLINAVQSVGPLELGLLMNGFSGNVNTNRVYEPGLHLAGIGGRFILFPSTQVTITFTDQPNVHADSGPISTRTGEDVNQPESGGQPIDICLSLQYRLPSNIALGKVYTSFGTAYHERFVLITRNTISNVAQTFTPFDFWTKRAALSEAMLKAVKDSLLKQGMAEVTQLQIMRIDFPQQYEDMITNIQLQVQEKSVKEYQQRVLAVLNNLEVLQATNEATITVIRSRAVQAASIMQNQARASALVMLQGAKANATDHVARALELSEPQVLAYLKLKALSAHPSNRTVVGLDSPVLQPPPTKATAVETPVLG